MERFDVASATSPAYVWDVAQKPLAVRLNLDLVERLEREVVDSFRSVTSEGSEIGGVLLGHVVAGARPVVVVEDYDLVTCDYKRGPLYRMDEGDRQRLDEALARHQAAGGLAAVGYFRSNTRKGLSLEADDLAVIAGKFADPLSIALLIRPFATRPSVGGIFLWENGVMAPESSALEFPFSRQELARTLTPAPPPAAAPAAAPFKPPTRAQIVPIAPRREVPAEPEALPDPEPLPELKRRSEARIEPLAAIPAAAPPAPAAAASPVPLAAAPAELAPAPAAAPPPPASAPAPLPLPPSLSGFAGSSHTREETGAADEPAKRNKLLLPLVGAVVLLLALAGVYFSGILQRRPAPVAAPVASNLDLRVERTGGELLLTWNSESPAIKAATGAVLFIADGDQQANMPLDLGLLRSGRIVYSPASGDVNFRLDVANANPAKNETASVRVLKNRPSPMPQENAAAQAAGAGHPVAAEAAAEGQEAPAAPKIQPRPFNPGQAEALAARLRPARPSDLPEPPSAGNSAAFSPGSAPAAHIAVPAAPLSAPIAPPAPVASAPRTGTPGSTRVGGLVKPAELISRVSPIYPALARQAHAQGQVVVEAIIGANGRVKEVRVLSGHPLFRQSATDAVRRWVYKPATLNGVAVETPTQIRLDFTNK
jgi:TonB family protein